ncbi:MAG: hypothetical protein EHM68_00965 [Lysobacterales bacterium]|nr:MAG: hypothetical protein EHM68_00965 [Xanthomonadales bacterium]
MSGPRPERRAGRPHWLLELVADGQFDVRAGGSPWRTLRPGEGVLVMTHDNVEVAYEKLKGVEGVQLVEEPRVTEFPRGDGGVFRVEGFRFLDPNGFFVDLNQTVE